MPHWSKDWKTARDYASKMSQIRTLEDKLRKEKELNFILLQLTAQQIRRLDERISAIEKQLGMKKKQDRNKNKH